MVAVGRLVRIVELDACDGQASELDLVVDQRIKKLTVALLVDLDAGDK